MTVRAVRGLLADLQKKIGDDTDFLTHHLTYDRLEGFFSAFFVAVAFLTRPQPLQMPKRESGCKPLSC